MPDFYVKGQRYSNKRQAACFFFRTIGAYLKKGQLRDAWIKVNEAAHFLTPKVGWTLSRDKAGNHYVNIVCGYLLSTLWKTSFQLKTKDNQVSHSVKKTASPHSSQSGNLSPEDMYTGQPH